MLKNTKKTMSHQIDWLIEMIRFAMSMMLLSCSPAYFLNNFYYLFFFMHIVIMFSLVYRTACIQIFCSSCFLATLVCVLVLHNHCISYHQRLQWNDAYCKRSLHINIFLLSVESSRTRNPNITPRQYFW